jgi:tripartite-type tricarboxylate transporter receptor subunit TctC
VARHLGDFVAGKPTIIVSNMPGASGTKAASYLYSIAPKDGSVIATFNKSMPLYQSLGQNGIAFKTEQMSWIGNVSQTADIVAVWHTTGVKTIAGKASRGDWGADLWQLRRPTGAAQRHAGNQIQSLPAMRAGLRSITP